MYVSRTQAPKEYDKNKSVQVPVYKLKDGDDWRPRCLDLWHATAMGQQKYAQGLAAPAIAFAFTKHVRMIMSHQVLRRQNALSRNPGLNVLQFMYGSSQMSRLCRQTHVEPASNISTMPNKLFVWPPQACPPVGVEEIHKHRMMATVAAPMPPMRMPQRT